jgi:hypothetical protein
MDEPAGDLRRTRRLAQDAWAAYVSTRAAAGVRDLVSKSWRRSATVVPADATCAPVDEQVDVAGQWRTSPLFSAVSALRDDLDRVVEDGACVAAITDETGKILWTHGSRWMRRRAEQVNFVPGGRWDEASIGTNALDLALRTATPQQVFSAEHFASAVHEWVCYAAPVLDPRSGRPIAVVDLSSTWDKANPLGLATATMIGRALSQLVEVHPDAGDTRVVTVRMLGSTPSAVVDGRRVSLSPRQLEVLSVLAAHPGGLSLNALHARVYPDLSVSLGTLKSEVSYLRRALGGGVASRPYRLLWPVVADFEQVADLVKHGALARALDHYTGPLAPSSESPDLVARRIWLHTALREAAIAAGDVTALFRIGERHPEDIEVHERCWRLLDDDDPRRSVVLARLALADDD